MCILVIEAWVQGKENLSFATDAREQMQRTRLLKDVLHSPKEGCKETMPASPGPGDQVSNFENTQSSAAGLGTVESSTPGRRWWLRITLWGGKLKSGGCPGMWLINAEHWVLLLHGFSWLDKFKYQSTGGGGEAYTSLSGHYIVSHWSEYFNRYALRCSIPNLGQQRCCIIIFHNSSVSTTKNNQSSSHIAKWSLDQRITGFQCYAQNTESQYSLKLCH